MAEALTERRVRAVILIGAMAPHIEEAIIRGSGGTHPSIVRCETLEDAVRKARELARPGDVVSLSPGCESFDQFRDYRHRADRFLALVTALPRDATAGNVSGRKPRWN